MYKCSILHSYLYISTLHNPTHDMNESTAQMRNPQEGSTLEERVLEQEGCGKMTFLLRKRVVKCYRRDFVVQNGASYFFQ